MISNLVFNSLIVWILFLNIKIYEVSRGILMKKLDIVNASKDVSFSDNFVVWFSVNFLNSFAFSCSLSFMKSLTLSKWTTLRMQLWLLFMVYLWIMYRSIGVKICLWMELRMWNSVRFEALLLVYSLCLKSINAFNFFDTSYVPGWLYYWLGR